MVSTEYIQKVLAHSKDDESTTNAHMNINSNPIRVGFHVIGGRKWKGGHQYQLNLLRTLQRFEQHRLTPILLAGAHEEPETIAALSEFLDEPVIYSNVVDETRRARRQVLSVLGFRNSSVNQLMIENQIDVVFENAFFWGRRLPVRSIAWFPDLQHLRLPHLFGRMERLRRQIGFRIQMQTDRTIMLSSIDAHNDLRHFFGSISNRVCVVPFAVPHRQPVSESVINATKAKYNIVGSYVLLPNQFWKHKNHALAVQAFAMAQRQGGQTQLVLTGNPLDHSGTGTFKVVKQLIDELGLSERVHNIGMIPYQELQNLMFGCTAMLNPSNFEGWSTTVEEAKAFGIPLLLSNLNVHREQAGDNATYFSQDSPDELAAVLRNLDKQEGPRTSRLDSLTLSQLADERLSRFGQAFYETCSSTLAKSVSRRK